jgi:hypothetical protein
MKAISGLVLLASLLAIASASKDSLSLYRNGASNPNVDNPMYWQDSENVLQDLAQFDKLYVQYHGCTWGPYFEASNGDNNENNNICSGGGDGGDDETWYLGQAGCNRAQVAYSLYGTLKGDRDKGCKKSRFINSFFTVGGLEAWISSMQAVGSLQDFTTYNKNEGRRQMQQSAVTNFITSTCTALGGDNNNRNLEDNNNGGGIYSYNQGATSTGVGCTMDGHFRLYQFQGSYCIADSSAQMVDSLTAFNSAIESQQCHEIYDSSSFYADDDGYGFSSLSVLAQSKACSLSWSPNCPDPYNKLLKYEKNMARAFLNEEDTKELDRKRRLFKAFGISGFVIGTIFFLHAFALMYTSHRKKRERGANTRKKEQVLSLDDSKDDAEA